MVLLSQYILLNILIPSLAQLLRIAIIHFPANIAPQVYQIHLKILIYVHDSISKIFIN